jgi:hypothetical protein
MEDTISERNPSETLRNLFHDVNASEKIHRQMKSLKSISPNLLNDFTFHERLDQCQNRVEKRDTIYDVHRFQVCRQSILKVAKKRPQRRDVCSH